MSVSTIDTSALGLKDSPSTLTAISKKIVMHPNESVTGGVTESNIPVTKGIDVTNGNNYTYLLQNLSFLRIMNLNFFLSFNSEDIILVSIFVELAFE